MYKCQEDLCHEFTLSKWLASLCFIFKNIEGYTTDIIYLKLPGSLFRTQNRLYVDDLTLTVITARNYILPTIELTHYARLSHFYTEKNPLSLSLSLSLSHTHTHTHTHIHTMLTSKPVLRIHLQKNINEKFEASVLSQIMELLMCFKLWLILVFLDLSFSFLIF